MVTPSRTSETKRRREREIAGPGVDVAENRR
jgi:hypothetical protein